MGSIFSRQNINSFCIYLILVLVNISYCPGIILTPNYNKIMLFIMMAVMISLSLNIKREFFFASSMYLYYGFYSLFLCSVTFLFYDVFIFKYTINIFLTITLFLLGYCCHDYSQDFIYRCIKIYICSALFLGLYSVFTNLGGFIISEQYAFSLKNSSGVLLGNAIILCPFVLVREKQKIPFLFFCIAMALLTICLLTFRCRTAIVVVIISVCYFMIKNGIFNEMIKKPFFFIASLLFLSLMVYCDILSLKYVYDSLFANTDVNDLNSITSGRLDMYSYGLKLYNEFPLLGNAYLQQRLLSIDNFIIYTLANCGLIGALLLFPPYILTWIICIKGMMVSSKEYLFPFMTLFLICMTSFTEAPFPFGPGTPVVLAWFLLGWVYKKQRILA